MSEKNPECAFVVPAHREPRRCRRWSGYPHDASAGSNRPSQSSRPVARVTNAHTDALFINYVANRILTYEEAVAGYPSTCDVAWLRVGSTDFNSRSVWFGHRRAGKHCAVV